MKQISYLEQEHRLFPAEARAQAAQELGVIAAWADHDREHDEVPFQELITRIDQVFLKHGVPVEAFETARVDLDGVTKEFSVRRDDLVHQAAIAAEAFAEGLSYDPEKTIMPVIIGGINPFIVRTHQDVVDGPKGFLVPNIRDEQGNVGRSQCIVVTGEMLEAGYGLGMLVADCPVENVVVTKKDQPDHLVAIAQTHNGWRQIADGSDIELQKLFAAEGWLDRDQFDIFVTPSSGVAYGFEMDREFVEKAMQNRGQDIHGNDRSHDVVWGEGPADPANADHAEYRDMKPSTTAGKAIVNMALTAHLNTIISLGLDTNETAHSSSWTDSLTNPARPSDRRAQMRYAPDPEVQKEHRTYRMLVALNPRVVQ